MKSLLILRHAKSSWKNQFLSDHDRPLNKRGQRDAPRIGKLIRREELTPDLILSSSAKRAVKTAEAVADACGYENDLEVARSFYHGSTETFIDVLSQVPDEHDRVMIVGHNPVLEILVEELTGRWETMPTAALANVSLPIEKWADLDENTNGTLAGFWIPRELSF